MNNQENTAGEGATAAPENTGGGDGGGGAAQAGNGQEFQTSSGVIFTSEDNGSVRIHHPGGGPEGAPAWGVTLSPTEWESAVNVMNA